jgi:hypothetical protein
VRKPDAVSHLRINAFFPLNGPEKALNARFSIPEFVFGGAMG